MFYMKKCERNVYKDVNRNAKHQLDVGEHVNEHVSKNVNKSVSEHVNKDVSTYY